MAKAPGLPMNHLTVHLLKGHIREEPVCETSLATHRVCRDMAILLEAMPSDHLVGLCPGGVAARNYTSNPATRSVVWGSRSSADQISDFASATSTGRDRHIQHRGCPSQAKDRTAHTALHHREADATVPGCETRPEPRLSRARTSAPPQERKRALPSSSARNYMGLPTEDSPGQGP